MLPARQIAAALKRAPLAKYEGDLCRTLRAATLYGFEKKEPYDPRPLYNLGPGAGGARFTPRGGAPALYLAEDYETALREYQQVAVSAQLLPSVADEAMVTFVAHVRLETVLDVTDAAVLELLETTPTELAEPWRWRRDRRTPPTHVLGRAVAAHGGIQAIRFASTKGPGKCFAIFTNAIKAPASVRVHDAKSRLVAALPRPARAGREG